MIERVKVLIIEDHPIVSDGCQRILSRRGDIVVKEAPSATAGLLLNREFLPDAILLDVGLPDANGFDIIQQLMHDNRGARIIIFSMYETPGFVTLALEKGARGYITKTDNPNAILSAIDKVLAGSVYLGQAVAQALAMINVMPKFDSLHLLNERERQILKLLGEGKSLTEISVQLVLGYKTVANTVTIIKQKLGLPTTPALIKFAVELKSNDPVIGALRQFAAHS